MANHNKRVAEGARKSRSRMVVIGLLKAHVTNGQPTGVDLAAGARVPFAGWGCAHLLLTEAHWDGLQRSFRRELEAWRKGSPTYAIAIVEPTRYGSNFDLVQIALMRVSPRAIPLDSGYEADVEDVLVAAERSFVKPIRYAEGDNTLPDFELLDVAHPPLPMEVFGLNSDEYAKRMQDKVAHYDQKHGPGGWWRWDAFSGVNVPALPPAAGLDAPHDSAARR